MGRKRIRSEEEDREYQKRYQREYYLSRKQTDKEYYKATFSRSYYRRVLRSLPEDDSRYEKVSQKVKDLDAKIGELLSTRNKYARLDICTKVNATMATI